MEHRGQALPFVADALSMKISATLLLPEHAKIEENTGYFFRLKVAVSDLFPLLVAVQSLFFPLQAPNQSADSVDL
jgi:hypothetical protein